MVYFCLFIKHSTIALFNIIMTAISTSYTSSGSFWQRFIVDLLLKRERN